MRYRARFRCDNFNGCGDIGLFIEFKLAAVRHVGFYPKWFPVYSFICNDVVHIRATFGANIVMVPNSWPNESKP